MSKKRKSFIIHHDSLNVLDDLTDEQAGLLFKAIKAYHLSDDLTLDVLTNIAMSPFRNQFDRDAEKYENLCEKNRLIAEARYNTKATTGKSGNKKAPKATKSTDNDSKSDSDNKSDSKSKEIVTSSGRFTPPLDIETVSYFELKGSTASEAERFWLFYDSKNWMIGKSKMKKWQSAASGWISRNKTEANKTDIMAASSASNWHEEDLGL